MTPFDSFDGFRLSPQQRRLWQLQQAGTPPYTAECDLEIEGPVDDDRLAAAIQRVVDRHEILRTSFRRLPSMSHPLQVVAPEGRAELSRLDPEAVAPESREGESRSFDLEGGPVLRALLAPLSPRRRRLLLSLPSLCCDTAGLGNLVQEILACYDGESLDEPVQYADLAQFQNELLETEEARPGRELWARNAGLWGQAARLPFEIRESSGGPFAPRSLTVSLPSLEDVGPLFLLAVWHSLLWRLGGEPEGVVGVAFDGRRYAELAGVPGLFVRYLPVPARPGREMPFRGLLSRLEESHAEAAAWQESCDASAFPLLTYGFDFQDAASALAAKDGSVFTIRRCRARVERFALHLSCRRRAGSLELEIEHAPGRFRASDVERLAGWLVTLLRGAADRPDAPLGSLSLLDEAERRQVLVESNDTLRPFEPVCVHHLVAAQAARTPEAPAVVCEDETLSYRDLDLRSGRLARRLRAAGVGPESVVGLLADRSVNALAGIFGILKAGGAYLPLDPSLPARRLELLLRDSGAVALLAPRRLAAEAAVHSRALWIDEEEGREPRGEAEAPVHAEPSNLAYVIYTSGSTGQAKGVAVEHRQLASYVQAASERLELPAGASFATVSTFAADLGHTMLFPALVNGGCLHVVSQDRLGDAARLGEYIRRHALDCLKIVPSHLQALLATGEPDVLPRRRLVLGGEASTWDLVADVRRLAPGCRIFNHYGPTETTVGVMVRPVAEGDPDDRSPRVPLGRPLAGCRTYLLDPDLDPVGTEEPGEVFIGGLSVARGYLGRPDLTAERFLPDPWGFAPGDRMYRTGDLARRRLDGEVEFLGRVDHQVKVRGFRVELGEVESALRAHPGVDDAVVIARERAPGETALTAFCVASRLAPTTAGLLAWLGEHLPDFMIPAQIVTLPALPLTANGKVDRQALPALAPEARERRPHFQPPRTPGEELLAGIFSEILKVDRIGRQDDFFTLGGHSLLVTQLVSRVRRAFGVELSLRTIFDRPTVEALAGTLAGLALEGAPPLPPIEPVGRQGRLPLSSSQARLWFLEQLRPGQATYNLPVALRLRGRLDRGALHRALGEIVRRHEVLRTHFPAVDGEAYPVISPTGAVGLPLVDLRALPPPRREREAARLCGEEARRPFDLAAGPVFRAALIEMADGDHAVALTLHHIAGDRWSLAILVREVAALYRAFAAGAESPLAAPPVQYVDFAAWQRSVLAGELLETQLEYWRRRLTGAPPVLSLPTDRPRPPVLGQDGASLPIRLDGELAEGLRRLARSEGATPFMVLLAALHVLLARLSGQRDVSVGIPIAGRREAATEALIGFFVNTLVLRAEVRLEDGFRELLQTVRQLSLDAYAHQDLPFERLVDALAPERSLSHSPLFQVAFAFQNVDLEALRLPGLETTLLETETGTAKFDLTFSLEDGSGALSGSLEYCRDLFDASTAARFLSHWRHLLAAIAAPAAGSLAALPLMGPEDRHQILGEWNDTAPPGPRDATIPELFAAAAGRHRDDTAVIAGRERLTYAELRDRSRRLAARLRRLGVGPEELVAVFLERSPSLIVGLLGILEAGGAYLPLDLSYPPARLASMLADAAWPLVLTRRDLADLLPARARTLSIDEEERAPEEAREGPAPSADNLAYVMFTSGSTGQPKGTAIPHRAVVRLVKETNFADLGPDQTFLQFAPTSFDASTLEIWGPLLNGGRLALFPDARASVEELGRFVETHGVTTLWLTAGLFHQRVEAGLAPLRSVRQLLAGGDVLSPSHVRQALSGLDGAVLINGYGPTENTTFTACHRLRAGMAVGDSVPIGRPVAGTTVYLLDGELRPVPVGVAAELYTGGDGLARGYLGNPELTAERFVPHPFADGQRLYRTGDLARWRNDGSLEFLGRADRQVKVRGFRIELGEIEACLTGHPEVRAAAVTVQGSGDGKWLAAHVAADALTAEDLRRHLQSRLPEFMLPQTCVVLAALPLTPNGKVDREALPPVEIAASGAVAAPRSWIEEVLSGLWCETLGRDRVGRDESFFELGGHSLLATRLVSRIVRTFDAEVSLQDLFEHSTVNALAQRIEERMRRQEAAAVPPIGPQPRDGRPLPLSFAQQRLWFLDQLEAGSPAFQVRTALRLSGDLRVPVLAAGLRELVRRHESLRTTFALREGSPVQVIHPPGPLPLPLVDLSGLPAGTVERESALLINREARRPFDLARGPLVRFLVARLAPSEHILLAAMHHIVSDGWSMEILIRETVTLYEAFSDGRPSPLPEPALHYADYAVWQRRWLRDGALEGELAYWRHRLRDAPALNLPADLPRPPVQTFRGAGHRMELSAELSRGLRQLSRQEGVTLFALMVAALDALLCHWTGSEDVVVGANVANRGRPGSENLIGFLVNQLVLRTNLTGNPSFREILRRVWRVTLEAYAHQDLPFDKLVEDLRPRREAGSSPLFQVKIDLDHSLPSRELSGLTVTSIEIERPWSHFDLLLQVLDSPVGLSLHLRYNRDLFTSARMAVLLSQLESLLELVARDPDVPLETLRRKLAEVASQREKAVVEQVETAARLELSRIQPRAARQAR